MKDEDKRKIVEAVGLCWHEKVEDVGRQNRRFICSCGKEIRPAHWRFHIGNQLNPDSPADMAKIWVAFIKSMVLTAGVDKFFNSIWAKVESDLLDYSLILTSAPDLATAMLEYFKEKE